MPRVSTLALFALALVGLARPAEARFGTQDCYSYLTLRQVQTRDYSYEVRQNCEIVPRVYPGGPVADPYGSYGPVPYGAVPVYAPGLVSVHPAYAPRRIHVGPRRVLRPVHHRVGRKFRRR